MLNRSGPAPRLLPRLARLAAACAAPVLAACVQNVPAGGPYPGLAEFSGREVTRVEFAGEMVVREDTLRAVIATQPTRCRTLGLPVCLFGLGRQRHFLSLNELQQDVARIQIVHRDHGYYGSRITPSVETAGGDAVEVRFTVVPGDLVTLQALDVEGTEGIVPPAELERRLPLREGGPFRRSGFLASADTIQGRLLESGYAYTQVLRNYTLDTIADVAQVRFEAVPGPLVRVDTVVILGAERLGQETVRRQLAIREDDVLRPSTLIRSQRNLYDFQMVNFASVEAAPDSLQLNPDSASSTVIVRVVEAPQYLAEVAGGYGTIDCFRTDARRLDRNFLGGGRTLELSGSLSKVGVGEPLSAGLEQSLCKELESDTLGNVLNYRAAADFVQPRLFGTRTSTTVSLFSERISEFETYVRTSNGGRLAVTREVAPQTLAAAAVTVNRGSTQAEPIFYCVSLERCTPADIEPLKESRWSNFFTLSAIRDRTQREVYPVSGYQVRSTVDWATTLLASDDRFLRLFGDASAYRRLRPGWVLAGRLQGGTFLEGVIGGDGYIPPERRFYAGGPNSVRGFQRNRLGPHVYVDVPEPGARPDSNGVVARDTVPFGLGGTSQVVASLELRVPSPVLRDNLRLAAFVDGGRVWSRSEEAFGGESRFSVTPGVGLRFLTPVGPIRLDAAYNPYDDPIGPLIRFTESGDPVTVNPEYDPRNRFVRRFQFYIAVGQAF